MSNNNIQETLMPKITLKPYEQTKNFEAAMRRFNKAVERDDTINEVRRREFYEKPSEVRKRRKAAAVKRARREQVQREEAARPPRLF
jgi:small subunit ribosomal protein S21